METGMKVSRIEHIDIFRSLGILLMIMGHIGCGYAFDFYIHAFHMPMFFWISGYLFKHRSKEVLPLRAYLKKKTKTLLLPYFVFGMAYFLTCAGLAVLRHRAIDVPFLKHFFWINTSGLHDCGALWFLTALFFTDTIFFLIDRYIDSQIFTAIIIVCLSILGNVERSLLPFTLPFALGPALSGLGLYYLGYLFRKYDSCKWIHSMMTLSWIPALLLTAAASALIFANGYINMRSGKYAFIPLYWVNAVLAIIAWVNLSRLVLPYLNRVWVGRWLRGIGRDSIVYVCMNQIVILCMDRCIELPQIVRRTAGLAAVLLVLWALSCVFTRTKLRILIGKQ